MRITNKIMQNNSLYNINNNKITEDQLNTMMSTGKKLTRPSDDPVIAIRALRLLSNVTQLSQYYEKNAKDAESWLNVTADALSTITAVLTDSVKQATKGSRMDLTLDDLDTIVTQMDALAKEYYSTGNVDYAGRYVFTGYRTDTPLTFDKTTTADYSDINDEFNASIISDSKRILGKYKLDSATVLDKTEADAVAELKATLANDVTTAKTYVGKKMDKNVATALNNAITAAENVGNTRDAVNTASANLATAVTNATASIELYKKVAEVIANAAKLGEVGKASFAAAGIQTAYDNGTITSLDAVNKAYNDAVAAQAEADAVAELKAALANDVTTAKTYVDKKMDKNVATALNNAITAAENVGNTRDAVNTASANLATAVTDATASIELYKKVAEYIAKVDALGEAAKASFADVQKAYNNGTITSLADVEAAYAEAVKAQEEANGIGDVTVDAKSQQIYTADGKAVNTLVHGINIVKEANGKTTKVLKK